MCLCTRCDQSPNLACKTPCSNSGLPFEATCNCCWWTLRWSSHQTGHCKRTFPNCYIKVIKHFIWITWMHFSYIITSSLSGPSTTLGIANLLMWLVDRLPWVRLKLTSSGTWHQWSGSAERKTWLICKKIVTC